MTDGRWAGGALAAGLAVFSSGCSFAFVPYPPSEPSDRTVDAAAECTTSHNWPIVDTLGVGLSVTNVVVISEGRRFTNAQKRVLGPVHIGYAVLGAASAVYGFLATSACDDLRREVKYDPNAGPRWTPALKK